MLKHRLLLVDDDSLSLATTAELLEGYGYTVDQASSGEDAIRLVAGHPHHYSLVILDYRMRGKDGAVTVEKLTELNPDLFVLMFSGDTSREAVLRTTRSGARGFVDKAEGPAIFLAEVKKWCRKFEETQATLGRSQETTEPSETLVENERLIRSIGLVGRSPALASIALTVQKLKGKNGPVLILGESGTGKELVARSLQHGTFKAVNCAGFASNPQLMASTLFGHVKGAFTGATQDKRGLLAEAEGGTVFLDEIHTLPPICQSELLRALQEKKIVPVGGTREIAVDFKLVTAGKPSLLQDVERGRFAVDLFYRISRHILNVPTLKDRLEDIEPLVDHFCRRWCTETKEQKSFLLRTLPYFESYAWPGNVRELENVVYSLLDLTPASKISPDHLDAKFFQRPLPAKTAAGEVTVFSLKERLEAVEKQHLISVLAVCRTLRECSRRMEVSLTTVLRLLRKHQIDPQVFLSKTMEKKARTAQAEDEG